MSSLEDIKNKEILVEGNHTFKTVTDKIAGIVEMKNSKAWLVGFEISNMFLLLLLNPAQKNIDKTAVIIFMR